MSAIVSNCCVEIEANVSGESLLSCLLLKALNRSAGIDSSCSELSFLIVDVVIILIWLSVKLSNICGSRLANWLGFMDERYESAMAENCSVDRSENRSPGRLLNCFPDKYRRPFQHG